MNKQTNGIFTKSPQNRCLGAHSACSGWALLIPAEAVAKLHHALTSDRAATFAAVAVELVTLLDLESNSGHGQTSEVQQQQRAGAAHPKSAWTSSFPGLHGNECIKDYRSLCNFIMHFLALREKIQMKT
jgi:hypothetical protein